MSMSQRHLLAIKAETNYGEDAWGASPPTSWLAIVGQPTIQESVQEMGPEEMTADGLGGQILRVGEMTTVSFTTYLVGKLDTAGDPPPELDALFKASNCAEEIVPTTSAGYGVSFGRMMASVPSMSVYEAIRDDVSGEYYTRLVTGVRGVPTITLEDGQDIRISFEGEGLYSELSETTTAITNPTEYSGGKDRLKCQGLTFTYGGDPYGITALELTTGMETAQTSTLTADNSVDAIGLMLSAGSKPGGSVSWASGEWANIFPHIKPPANDPVPTGELIATITDGTDTVKFTGTDTAVGAYAKNLQGGNYTYDTPLTCLGGLGILFT